jgi:hypothetical protein
MIAARAGHKQHESARQDAARMHRTCAQTGARMCALYWRTQRTVCRGADTRRAGGKESCSPCTALVENSNLCEKRGRGSRLTCDDAVEVATAQTTRCCNPGKVW